MIIRMTAERFMDGMANAGRADSWSYSGLRALYEYLEDLDHECGTETEFDPIAIDCSYTEWESIEEFIENMGNEYCPDNTIDSLQDNGITVIPVPDSGGGFITQEF